jgi:hypothetical protein
LRWFLLPSEAQKIIRGSVPSLAKVPFTPRQYLPIKSANFQLHHYSTISSINKIKNASETVATVADDLDRELKLIDIIESQHDYGNIVNGHISESMNLKHFTTTIIVNVNVKPFLKYIIETKFKTIIFFVIGFRQQIKQRH